MVHDRIKKITLDVNVSKGKWVMVNASVSRCRRYFSSETAYVGYVSFKVPDTEYWVLCIGGINLNI